jgi:hypothetical protein
MPPLSADQLNTLRTNATELQPAPIIKISLHTTNRKIHTPTNINIEQDTDTTISVTLTDIHTQNSDDTTTDQINNRNNTTVHTNAPSTTDFTPEHNLSPTRDNTTTTPNVQDTTPAQPTANLNQGQLFTQYFQRKASNTKYKPIQGGKGQVHKLRTTDSNKTKTDTPTLIPPPQRAPISHHSSQQSMEQQIQKMQQQHIASLQHTQTVPDTQLNTSRATTEPSDTLSAPATVTLQTQNPRPLSNSSPPTEDTTTLSTDMHSTLTSTKERRGNFHEARRTHEPP